MAIEYRKALLGNGTSLVLVSSDNATSVMVRAMIAVGSRHETDDIAGAAHLLEHMVFRGTKRRPDPMDINTELSVRGADSNAFTMKDYTEYYVQAASQELPWAMDIIHDMISGARLDPEELERERKIVLEEMASYDDDPSAVAEERSFERLFGNLTLGRPIVGYRKTVKALTSQQLADFLLRRYRPQNMIVVVSGGFDPDKAIALARETFGSMPVFPNLHRFKPAGFSEAPSGPSFTTKAMDFTQTHVALTFRGFRFNHPLRPAQNVLCDLLGGDVCSRVWREIREKRGLAYSIAADNDFFDDTGTLSICGELNAKRSVEAVGLIASECADLASSAVTQAELDRVKSAIRGEHALDFESPHDQAAFYASRILYGAPNESLQQRLDDLLSVTAAQVQAVAQTIFRLDRLSFAATGSVSPVKSYEQAIRKHIR